MATSLLVLLDDIATVLDDVALMTKVAAKKTAGVLGDDLALNAEQVSGVRAERELPVVWAVAKGSMRNKLILVPAALVISAIAPWAITPLLMLGGAYLCFEGFEKLAHKFLHSHAEDVSAHADKVKALADPEIDLVAFEKDKISGAIRTDFILSAEIIVIALGTVQDAPLSQRIIVVAGIAAVMTVGVYSLVGGIVKLDDLGLHLIKAGGRLKAAIGRLLLTAAPKLMKALSVIGTAAMFMVGGGILVHGLPAAHHFIDHLSELAAGMAGVGPVVGALAPSVLSMVAGVIAGGLVLLVVAPITSLISKFKSKPA
ncbi:DUF808 domain-containing protein [Uliginosibacterium sp. H3]|uniref:DUF808 domain-containing protein n=1 Tax=Uliginosibacterium silvisoli TaxID=3114758 RepID=A0ABU6K4Q6_9RHOO|nr:DUF808 domain-containing protein [Uliginosibacterium sp. H3]